MDNTECPKYNPADHKYSDTTSKESTYPVNNR